MLAPWRKLAHVAEDTVERPGTVGAQGQRRKAGVGKRETCSKHVVHHRIERRRCLRKQVARGEEIGVCCDLGRMGGVLRKWFDARSQLSQRFGEGRSVSCGR